MKLNKLILIPLLSAIAEFVKQSTGYEVPGPWLDLSADLILGLIIPTIGILMHPRKPKEVAGNVFTTPIEPSA